MKVWPRRVLGDRTNTHPASAAAPLPQKKLPEFAPPLFSPDKGKCATAGETDKGRLVREVRLPCAQCGAILPPFTASWERGTGGVAVQVVQCPSSSCGARQKIMIKPTFETTAKASDEETAELRRLRNGYKTTGISSLNWSKDDPCGMLAV